MVTIRKYSKQHDEANVMQLIANEDGWDYANSDMAEQYKAALEQSVTYVAYFDNQICGYSRSLNDCGFYIYVCDLLVSPTYRGHSIGKQLMECIYAHYPNHVVYVMSGVDGYYEKVGYSKEGSIYLIPNPSV